MKVMQSLTAFSLLSIAAIVGMSLLTSRTQVQYGGDIPIAGKAASKYDKAGLGNASPAQMSDYAIRFAINNHEAVQVTPTVLLARRVTRADVAALGLGCMGENATIEEPPLMLVVLKGNFSKWSPALQVSRPRIDHYLAYVFDQWAGLPTYRVSSPDGTGFRKALNDPRLQAYPQTESAKNSVCPTPQPVTKTLHYGDIAPGFTTPPPLPADVQSALATQAVISPVPSVATPYMPLPVNTASVPIALPTSIVK